MTHNIAGCEAIFEPGRTAREGAFSPAHGAIVELPRRGRPRAPTLLLAFAAGALAVVAAAVLLGH